MTFKEIQELIKLIAKAELSEFKLKDGDFQIHLRGKGYKPEGSSEAPIINVPAVAPAYAPAPASPAPAMATPAPAAAAPAAPAASADEGADQSKLIEIRSPMIGTFYRSSTPDKPPYIKVGDTVAKGDVVCIVEAMKLFNEIESEVSGKIVKVMVEDAQPIEYDQVLFMVEPG
ncbi:MAG: acetyl-CoA carboxylase biotin carboxyl carrier protein [Bacteroidota bacterium]